MIYFLPECHFDTKVYCKLLGLEANNLEHTMHSQGWSMVLKHLSGGRAYPGHVQLGAAVLFGIIDGDPDDIQHSLIDPLPLLWKANDFRMYLVSEQDGRRCYIFRLPEFLAIEDLCCEIMQKVGRDTDLLSEDGTLDWSDAQRIKKAESLKSPISKAEWLKEQAVDTIVKHAHRGRLIEVYKAAAWVVQETGHQFARPLPERKIS